MIMRRKSRRPSGRLASGSSFIASWAVILVSVLVLAIVSACSLLPSQVTLNKQVQSFPWPFGNSVSDGVYSPTISEDVYSKD
ncbi:hypothetical protein ACFQ3W_07400 [Paenibacillus puldeungensis]|uniref:Uncharacterized protein n=1 Tax=Paenibacillus puldeungensis TaxID=696536 RepID=A0ABW3RWM2_9BACL